MPRLRLAALGICAVAALAVVATGYRNATADPVVRRLSLHVPDYPAQRPITLALFSDVHVHPPDMPPERVEAIIDQMNALKPDLIIAAGDFGGAHWIGGSYSVEQVVAPLAGLKAPLGVYAVLGNNDYQAGAEEMTRQLQDRGLRVLRDEVVNVGPLSIAGMTGDYSNKKETLGRRERLGSALSKSRGVEVLVVHRPDEFHFAPSSTALTLAGHTHCGQIVLPLVGALQTGSDFGQRYACGVVQEDGKTLVVSAGLGTSKLPLRFGAPPDVWLVSIGR